MSTTVAPFAAKLPPCSFKPQPYTGPSREQVLADRREFLSPGLITYYKNPIMLVDGHMQYLFDETGRRYLDLFAGIVSVSCGHGHPKIVKRVQEQVGRLQHTTTIYMNPNVSELGRKLASKLPGDLKVAYFTNSGSEANDLAILMARLYTGNRDVVGLRNCYHGASGITMGLTSHHTWKYAAAAKDDIYHAASPDPYRSLFKGTPAEIAKQSVDDLRDVIRYSTTGKLAAFIAEPIQGVGGTTHGSKEYLGAAYKVVREHGGLCIADEVQTGFGRTGDHYWGFQNYDVMPDIVTMAKSLGNGAPIAAVVTRPEIAETMRQKLHVNTFGGNPVSSAAGLAVLDVIEEDGLQKNAKVLGEHFIAGMKKLQGKHKIIGDVRGMGLMLGMELVKDRETKEPARDETAALHEGLRELGVLVGKGGLFGNVLRIKPPLCITRDDVDYALAAMDHVLASL
ncbi:aminotransferase class III-fold pyridoxal phosphate-dependent enzyme [bacterium]|nr:aminotransferase class III-fold pyridoxal phosphate-dependent enzyme [bacterium]